jgi:hypothetical protein
MQIKRQLQATLVAEAICLLTAINSGRIAYAQTGSPPPAMQSAYQFTTIDIPGVPGGISPSAYGINDTGVVSGGYLDGDGNDHGFLRQNGTVTTVDAAGSVDTALGVANNQGFVIGNYGDLKVIHAAIYNVGGQTWTPLPDIANKPVNSGNAINDNGVAVGTALEGNLSNNYHGIGWVWDGNAYSFFTVPEATNSLVGTYPTGINDAGLVVGYYEDSKKAYHGFLKSGSTITSFDVPGGNYTIPGTVNNNGDVVGYYGLGSVSHGFVLHAGGFVTVDVPGATSTYIYGNNNRGQLTGSYSDE